MTDIESSSEGLLSAIEYLAKQSQEHDQELKNYVARARGSGVTWEQIGKAAGVTKQAANKRWKGLSL